MKKEKATGSADWLWELINDVGLLNNELEWAIDNLDAVHTTMEEDEGTNWQRRCNAVFSIYLQLCSIQKRIDASIDQAGREQRAQRAATK